MEFKISSIKIECDKGNILIPLSDHISFFYGNTSVGKTTLLNLINYAFGQNLIRTQIIENEVRRVCVDAYICGRRIIFERNVPSNLITIRDNDGINSFSTKRNQGGKDTFSDYLYKLAGVPSLDFIIGKNTNTTRVSFANFMWYSYLKQDELDNGFFYLEDNNIRKYASNYVLRSIVLKKGQIDSEKQKKLHYIKTKYEDNREKQLLINNVFSQSKLFSINIGNEITKKRGMLAYLNEKLNELIQNRSGFDKKNIEELLIVSKSIGKYEAEIIYLREFYRIKELQREYENKDREYRREIAMIEKVIKSEKDLDEDYIDILQNQFKECLLEVKFPGLTEDNIIRIDRENMIPSVFSCNDDYLFSYTNLSSGGVRSLYKICYALAIHLLVAKMNIGTLLPTFIMIDTPMKNISERNDRVIYSNLYSYLYKLFSENGALYGTQLILVDKEKSLFFEQKGIEGKMFTRENPLIPV